MTELPLEIDCHDLQTRLVGKQDLVLIDCREEEEYTFVSIAGSRSLPMSEIQNRMGELEELRDRHIVVLCHHGMRSAQVAAWLRDHDFTQAQSLAGGIDLWAETIDPSMKRY